MAVAVDRSPELVQALIETAKTFGATGARCALRPTRAAISLATPDLDVDLPRSAVRPDDPWPWLLPACAQRLAPAAGYVYAEAGRALPPPPGLSPWRHDKAGQCIIICSSEPVDAAERRHSQRPSTMIKVVYPGTFDPFTRGHEDLVRRAAQLFDQVIVGVADSESKRPFFSAAERVAMAREVLAPLANVEVIGVLGAADGFRPRSRARSSSCAACARCPTSSTSSRWRE